MESKTIISYHGECRCCLKRGDHQDMRKEYNSDGTREVYSEMFMDCFNLYLSTCGDISTLICSSCVLRLRDANTFKTMVMESERQLISHVQQHTLFVNVAGGDDLTDKETKAEIKEELDDPEYDDDPDYIRDDDDQYLIPAITVSEVNKSRIKRSRDCLTECELLDRFPKGILNPLPTRNTLYAMCTDYVKNLDRLKDKIVTAKMVEKIMNKPIRERKVKTKTTYFPEKWAHVQNVTTLLEFSNITAFKSKTRFGYPCFFCRSIYDTIEALRIHQIEHPKNTLIKIVNKYEAERLVLYGDITHLKCTICNMDIASIEELKTHLTKVHNKKMYPEFSDRVIPFKLTDDNYQCQICSVTYETFGSLERHLNVHFRNYVCEECGAGFITKHRLKVHLYHVHKSSEQNGATYPCELCNKVYETRDRYKYHVNNVHKKIKKNKCPKCSERFSDYFSRQQHMVEAHGISPLRYKCKVCDKTFKRGYALKCHVQRTHLEEKNFQCDYCTYSCYTRGELKMHIIKHNGERTFECSVCKKAYARKKTLSEHMKIHNNDRRYVCPVCGQAFVQNCSLKGHMKTHHMDYLSTIQ